MAFVPYEAPFWFGTGSQVAGASVVSPDWPTHEEGDIGVLIVNTGAGTSTASITANGTGWIAAPDSPLAMAGTFNASNPHVLHVYLCRATSGAMAAPEVTRATAGDYITAQIGVIRGCRQSGSVLDAVQVTAATAHSGVTTANSIVFPAVTTTAGRSLIVLIASTGDDGTSVSASTITNSNLYFPTEQIDNGTSTGGGGETYVAQGRWLSAGDVGSTTVAVSPGSRQFARMTMAFIPPQEADVAPEGSWTVPAGQPSRGRLEGRITVPTGGWDTTVGAGTATIPAGTYYPTSFLAEVATQFAAASSVTCDVTGGTGENGTGLATLVFGSAKAISWVDTEVRDILGFTSNQASAVTHVGTQHIRNLWLPNCHYAAPNSISDSFRGYRVADVRSAENAAGYTWTHMGEEKVWTWLRWPAISLAKTWQANETTVNASWERFCRDAIWGIASWGTPGGPVRFYPNAGLSTYATYSVPGVTNIQPEPRYEGWAGGPHTIEIPRLVMVPGT